MTPLKIITDSELGSNKKKVITSFFYNLNSTIAELAKELNLSIPTVTKLVNEMVEEGILNDYGKTDSKSGRKPSTYGLNPQSGYFLGIDIKRGLVNIGICNFNGEVVRQDFDIAYNMESQETAIDEICKIATDFIEGSGIERSKILNACVNIGGVHRKRHTRYGIRRVLARCRQRREKSSVREHGLGTWPWHCD